MKNLKKLIKFFNLYLKVYKEKLKSNKKNIKKLLINKINLEKR